VGGLIAAAVAIGGLLAAMVIFRRGQRVEARLNGEITRLGRNFATEVGASRLSDARWAALGVAVLEAVVVVDRDLAVTYITPGAQALLDPERACLGRSLIDLTRSSEVHQLALDALAAGASSAGPREELDRVVALADRPFRVRAVGYEGGVVLALSDVSELLRLGRARRDFVANISHELRTPLTSIRLLLDGALAAEAPTPAQTTALLKKVQVEVEVLQQIAQELLDLAQIESGQAPLRMVPTAVAEVVDGVVERLGAQAQQKHQTVHIDVPADLMALADAASVGRALSNLLHNAIKFTPSEGRIWISACAMDGDVRIEVRDNGPGIPPEDLPRVFERFFRGDQARAGGGTGLGLAIAKHIVEGHGGMISVESDGIRGHGATFTFTLPLMDERAPVE
jgi:two-component system, OmpR family, phosphate regulon sensor histidine kinase PhoR